MKHLKTYLLLILGLSIIFVFCSKQKSEEDAQLQQVTENLYAIFGMGGNVAFLVTDEGVLVVDSGTYPSSGKELVEKIGQVTDKKIKYLVITHYHGDHTQGAQYFPSEAVVISHANTRKNLEKLQIPRIEAALGGGFDKRLKAAEEKVEKLKSEENPELEKAMEDLESLKNHIQEYRNLRLILPETILTSDTTIHLGGHDVELLHKGRGHTDGDLIVYFPQEKAVHMGDLLFHRMIPYIETEAGSDTENWIRILEHVAKMDVEKVIPGHGEITDRNGLLAKAEYLKTLRGEVGRLIKEGASLDETIGKIDLSGFHDFEGYAGRLGQNVGAVYEELSEER